MQWSFQVSSVCLPNYRRIRVGSRGLVYRCHRALVRLLPWRLVEFDCGTFQWSLSSGWTKYIIAEYVNNERRTIFHCVVKKYRTPYDPSISVKPP